MKLSKLTKKLLCTSLVAVGIITTMGGFNANAATVTQTKAYGIALRYGQSSSSTVESYPVSYVTDGSYTYQESSTVSTRGFNEYKYLSSAGRYAYVYHAAYTVSNGTTYTNGYFKE